MEKSESIYIAGHQGLVGSALHRTLAKKGFTNFITRTMDELDLRDQATTRAFFLTEKPDYVLLAAAKVGGIHANNTYRAEFIYDNLMVQNNVIHSAHEAGVKKLLFLGSSCVYPKMAPQPIPEDALLTSPLEPTNEPYAIAKIAGIKMCDAYRSQYGSNFISVMPTNLYGPNDNYHSQNAHVLPALMRRFIEATRAGTPEVVVWGSGSPLREFLYVDDMADACCFLMEHYNEAGLINIGYGEDVTIKELAETIKDVVGYTGTLTWDTSKPDGTPRKLIDSTKLRCLGWKPSITLRQGLEKVYEEVKNTEWKD